MALENVASSTCITRGFLYYRKGKVQKVEKINDNEYSSVVTGSNGENYNTHINVEHPRTSTCDCPYAKDNSKICKHMVATYFSVFPDEAEEYYNRVGKYEEEEDKRVEGLRNKLSSCLKKMSREDLEKSISDFLLNGPEWLLDDFIYENNFEEFLYQGDEEEDE